MTKKNYLRKSTPVIIVIILAGIYFLSLNFKSNEPELNSVEIANLSTDINMNNQEIAMPIITPVEFNNWSEYIKITKQYDKWLGTQDCGNSEFNVIRDTAESGDIYLASINGVLEILWTDNTTSVSHDVFIAFNGDSNAICAAGGRYPLAVIEGKLLWIGSCGGIEISESFNCTYAKSAVENYVDAVLSVGSDSLIVKNVDSTGSIVVTNNIFNYQITFPSSWIYDNEASNPDLIAAFDKVATQQVVDTELIQGMKLEIQTGLLNALNGRTIDEYISNREFQEYYISEDTVLVDGRSSQQKVGNVLGYSISTYVVNGDTVVNIIGYIGGNDDIEKYTEVYNEILASFQFI